MERTRRDTMLLAGAVALLGLLAYGNSLQGAFVFDDVQQVQDNLAIRDLGEYLLETPGHLAPPNRFVSYLSFALNYQLGGLAVRGFHLVNLLVHLGNALLVFGLVLLAFRTPRLRESRVAGHAFVVAFAAAALFVTHPIQTQAVTYIVQRITSLATLFYLAAVLLYLSSRLAPSGRRRTFRYALSLLSALLAVRTKEIAFTLPFALLLLEWAFFGRPAPRQWLGLAPFGAIALVIPLSLLRLDQPVGQVLADASTVTRVQDTGSRFDYLRTEIAVISTYLRLLLWPAGQNIDHDFPVLRSFLAPRVAWGLLVHASLLTTAVVAWRRSSPRAPRPVDPAWRLVSVGILLFFLGHAVESSLIPIVDVIFEHRVYLPSVGFFVAVAAAGTLLLRRWKPDRFAPWVIGGSAVVALLLSGATLARNRVWASDLALWSDAVSKSPGKARPWFNLGTALAELGRDQEAVEPMRRAVQLDPGWAKARAQLGGLLILTGRTAEAEPVLREALRLQPGEPATMFNLAEAIWRSGRRKEAAGLFREYLDLTTAEGNSQLRKVAAARVRIVAAAGD
jgi:tetratricopeptide (TPR) repeat protein